MAFIISVLSLGLRARVDAELEWPSGELIYHGAIDRWGDGPPEPLERCTHRHGTPKQAGLCASKRLTGNARPGWEDVRSDPIEQAIEAAVQARAAAREMRWREDQEREIRYQQDVLPLEIAADRAVQDATKALHSLIWSRASKIEAARLETVPEQSEWHIHVHGEKVKCPLDCDGVHTCPGCGDWLYHGKGACGPCVEEM